MVCSREFKSFKSVPMFGVVLVRYAQHVVGYRHSFTPYLRFFIHKVCDKFWFSNRGAKYWASFRLTEHGGGLVCVDIVTEGGDELVLPEF